MGKQKVKLFNSDKTEFNQLLHNTWDLHMNYVQVLH